MCALDETLGAGIVHLAQVGDDVAKHTLRFGMLVCVVLCRKFVLSRYPSHSGMEVLDDRFLCNGGIAHGHVDTAMAKKLHDVVKAHAGVDKLGSVGVTKPMGDDFSRYFDTISGAPQSIPQLCLDLFS